MPELTIPNRFNGPPDSANGGYLAGRLASFLPGSPAVQVTLRRPPPLNVPMDVRLGESVLLHDGPVLVAEAIAVDAVGAAVQPVSPEQALAAMTGFGGHAGHPFPTCFVCGPGRSAHDGLELFSGPTSPDHTATIFDVRSDLATGPDQPAGSDQPAGPDQPTGPDQPAGSDQPAGPAIGPEILWCALDCPGGWSMDLPGRPAVLGRMTAAVHSLPAVGERCVVVGVLDGREGRKAFTRTTAYGADGRELGRASQVWITVA